MKIKKRLPIYRLFQTVIESNGSFIGQQYFKTMNTTTLKSIARGALTGISLIVSVVQIVEFTTHTVMWYRNRKIATDTNSVAED